MVCRVSADPEPLSGDSGVQVLNGLRVALLTKILSYPSQLKRLLVCSHKVPVKQPHCEADAQEDLYSSSLKAALIGG